MDRQPRGLLVLAAIAFVGGAGLLAVDLAAPAAAPTGDTVALLLAAVGAAVASFWAAQRGPPETRRAWTFMGASATISIAGQALWSLPLPLAAGLTASDVVYVVSLLLGAAGILSFPFHGNGSPRARALLEGLIVGGALLTVSWVVLLARVAQPLEITPRFFASIAYPVADLLLITLVFLVARRANGPARPAFILFAAGLGILAVTDSAYAYFSLRGEATGFRVFSVGWWAGYAFVALAAVRTVQSPGGTFRRDDYETDPSRIVITYLPAFVALLATAWEVFRDGRLSAVTFTFGSLTVAALLGRQIVVLAELTQERRARREAEAARRQLLHNVVHDFATPLSTVRLQTHVLRAQNGHSPTRPIDVIDRSADQIGRLLADLRDLANLEDGRLALSVAPLDLRAVVADCADSLEASARAKEVVLRVEAPTSLVVEGDAARLTQVLTNLVGNAIKFTPAGGTVTVALAARADGAAVTVKDTGPGLTPEQLTRLFRPFSRVHDTSRGGPPGTGLGLFIAKGIVDRHGGRLWAESDGVGRGATFVVVLPASSVSPPAAPLAVGSRPRAAPGP